MNQIRPRHDNGTTSSSPGHHNSHASDGAILGAVFGMAGVIFVIALSIWIYKRTRPRSVARIDPLLIESGNAYVVPPRFAESFHELPTSLRPSARERVPQSLSYNPRESISASSLTHVSQLSSFVRFFTSTPKSQSSASSGQRRRSFVREYATGQIPDTPTSVEKYNFSQIQPPQSPPPPQRSPLVVMNPSSRSGNTTSSGTKSIKSKASQLKSFFFNTHPSTSAAQIAQIPPKNLQAQIPQARPRRRLVVMNPSSSHSSSTSRSTRSRFSIRRKRSSGPKASRGHPPHRSHSESLPISRPLPKNPRGRASDPIGSSSHWKREKKSSVLGPRPISKRSNVPSKHVP